MSTTYHPQTDGQSERTIKTLEDMLRALKVSGHSAILSWAEVGEQRKVMLIRRSRKPLEFSEVTSLVQSKKNVRLGKGVVDAVGKKGKLPT
ncbi:putative reverse transcriptase domain-containing protein [Tanacetum coccineum]|uniref:Reverse transcriptase domain-containing protein n=1 Tax=Tanacetum coccineum TaxID=301880 RepID=A0ABQ5IBJ3_9ASTR